MKRSLFKEMSQSLKIVYKHTNIYKTELISLIIIGFIGASLAALSPYIIGLFFDSLLDFSKTYSIGDIVIAAWFGIVLLFLFVEVVEDVVNYIFNKRSAILWRAINLGYQARVFRNLLFLPISYHKDNKIGELSDHISRAGFNMANVVDTILDNISYPLFTFLTGAIITFAINPIFLIIFVLEMLIYIFLFIRVGSRVHKDWDLGNKKWSESSAHGFQTLTNVESVKQTTNEDYEVSKIEKLFLVDTMNIWRKVTTIWANVDLAQKFVTVITIALILFLSVNFIQQGTMTIGELVTVNAYAVIFFGAIVSLCKEWQFVLDNLVKIRQSEEKIFYTKHENYHPKGAYTPKEIEGSINFENVVFNYDKGVKVLENINFKVNPGEKIAFVGKSGVGKSTAIDLISGYYFATKGKVLVDNHDVKKFDLTALRSGIAIVPQEPSLFNDTIMKNIHYGNLNAKKDEVIKAAKKAKIHDFIQTLPKKYNQLVGERGVKLSVGQKQRVAIARAILRNPSILILDEPTSALDAETEKHIAESFEKLMKGRTTLIVAHRLSTIRKADRIFVFDKGKIVEEGKHDELLKKKNGVYKRLHDSQIGLY